MNKKLLLIIAMISTSLHAKDISPFFNAGIDFVNLDEYVENASSNSLSANDSIAFAKIGFGVEGRINNQFKVAGLFNYGFESTNSDVTANDLETTTDISIKNLSQFQVKFMFEPQEDIYLFFAPTYTSVEYQYESIRQPTRTNKETDMGFALGGGLNVSKKVSLEAQIARISSDVSQFGLTASFKF